MVELGKAYGDNIRAISDLQLIDGELYLCPSFQMRLIIAVIIWLHIVLYNEHNSNKEHSFNSSSA